MLFLLANESSDAEVRRMLITPIAGEMSLTAQN
jgi:hypothetical protein